MSRPLRFIPEGGALVEVTCRALFQQLAPELAGGKLNTEDFLYSHRSWDFLSAQYREFSSDPSFVDYFWTVRTMHSPVWILADVAKNMIPPRFIIRASIALLEPTP